MRKKKPPAAPSEAAIRNISRIAELESQFEQTRTSLDRVIARIATATGSLPFFIFHIIWFSAWTIFNGMTHDGHTFDPYPFNLLAVIIACEAVLLSIVVLIEQNWLGKRAERLNHIHLQVNLLAEQEVTKVLELQRLICKRLGISEALVDPEVEEMMQETKVEHLAEELGNTLSTD